MAYKFILTFIVVSFNTIADNENPKLSNLNSNKEETLLSEVRNDEIRIEVSSLLDQKGKLFSKEKHISEDELKELEEQDHCSNGIGRGILSPSFDRKKYKSEYYLDDCVLTSVIYNSNTVYIHRDEVDSIGLKISSTVYYFGDLPHHNILSSLNAHKSKYITENRDISLEIYFNNRFGGIPETDAGAGGAGKVNYYQFGSSTNYNLFNSELCPNESIKHFFSSVDKNIGFYYHTFERIFL
ncbi:hypothetical protein BCT06_12905 [Vibrio breoganii]|uniref:hypothetical protein n=1 Tax=Vibrio breoganii TaxID=553239 RepID=UPI000C81F016|nr:hypothetical protein [Vibrio breoganii]PML18403.1 hypothetical protein BCT84_20050 [Vibrio breoganii]PMO29655.1 hypothetical protein BCT12_07385 [Vibrio breoganii]PMO60313.1 hypothetical protein BCT06_12905 [Vibrio breoganii]